MKKSLFILAAGVVLAPLFGTPTPQSDGNWTEIQWSEINAPDTYPNSTAYNADISTQVIVNSNIQINNLFMKSGGTLIFTAGNSLAINTGNYGATGAEMKFLGGTLTTLGNFDQEAGKGSVTFGGLDDNGVFKAASAKSFNSTKRLMIQGEGIRYNLGASNLQQTKSAGLDENAIIYTTGEVQQMKSPITIDLTNIGLNELEDGTYYVALLSFGVTYKTLEGAEFDPLLDFTKIDGAYAKFEGFEWSHFTDGSSSDDRANNTLYAKISVSNVVPEPSAYAAVFGALALLLAVRMRRN